MRRGSGLPSATRPATSPLSARSRAAPVSSQPATAPDGAAGRQGSSASRGAGDRPGRGRRDRRNARSKRRCGSPRHRGAMTGCQPVLSAIQLWTNSRAGSRARLRPPSQIGEPAEPVPSGQPSVPAEGGNQRGEGLRISVPGEFDLAAGDRGAALDVAWPSSPDPEAEIAPAPARSACGDRAGRPPARARHRLATQNGQQPRSPGTRGAPRRSAVRPAGFHRPPSSVARARRRARPGGSAAACGIRAGERNPCGFVTRKAGCRKLPGGSGGRSPARR